MNTMISFNNVQIANAINDFLSNDLAFEDLLNQIKEEYADSKLSAHDIDELVYFSIEQYEEGSLNLQQVIALRYAIEGEYQGSQELKGFVKKCVAGGLQRDNYNAAKFFLQNGFPIPAE